MDSKDQDCHSPPLLLSKSSTIPPSSVHRRLDSDFGEGGRTRQRRLCPRSSCCRRCDHAARLTALLVVSFAYAIVEMVVGIQTDALTLTSDAFHMVSDVIAQIVALLCIHYSSKPSKRNTYGWARAEVLGALINASFLVAIMLQLITGAVERMIRPRKVKNPPLLLGVGACGLLLNCFGLALLGGHGHSHGGGGQSHGHSHGSGERSRGGHYHGHAHENGLADGHPHSHTEERWASKCHASRVSDASEISEEQRPELNVQLSKRTSVDDGYLNRKRGTETKKKPDSGNMNIRGVVLHLAGDAVGSLNVIISAALIWKWNDEPWTLYIDPSLTLCSVILIVSTTIPLLKVSSMILLQSVPGHVSIHDLQSRLVCDIDGVLAVHELHVWELSVLRAIATAHVHVSDYNHYERIAADVKEFFHNEGIHSTTIQPEFGTPLKDACLVQCEPECAPLRCCSSELIQKRSGDDKIGYRSGQLTPKPNDA